MNRIPTLEDLKRERISHRNINLEQREKLSGLEKIALVITERVGTMGFFLVVFTWTVIWLGWNLFAPEMYRFDPFPAFVLWLFISNMIQIMLMPLIMVGQNLQGKHAAARAEYDFEVNLKAEHEVEVILKHLENLEEKVAHVLDHLDPAKKK